MKSKDYDIRKNMTRLEYYRFKFMILNDMKAELLKQAEYIYDGRSIPFLIMRENNEKEFKEIVMLLIVYDFYDVDVKQFEIEKANLLINNWKLVSDEMKERE